MSFPQRYSYYWFLPCRLLAVHVVVVLESISCLTPLGVSCAEPEEEVLLDSDLDPPYVVGVPYLLIN